MDAERHLRSRAEYRQRTLPQEPHTAMWMLLWLLECTVHPGDQRCRKDRKWAERQGGGCAQRVEVAVHPHPQPALCHHLPHLQAIYSQVAQPRELQIQRVMRPYWSLVVVCQAMVARRDCSLQLLLQPGNLLE